MKTILLESLILSEKDYTQNWEPFQNESRARIFIIKSSSYTWLVGFEPNVWGLADGCYGDKNILSTKLKSDENEHG